MAHSSTHSGLSRKSRRGRGPGGKRTHRGVRAREEPLQNARSQRRPVRVPRTPVAPAPEACRLPLGARIAGVHATPLHDCSPHLFMVSCFGKYLPCEYKWKNLRFHPSRCNCLLEFKTLFQKLNKNLPRQAASLSLAYKRDQKELMPNSY